MIWTQTKAIFVDAFRELHARKLFWITMVLSLLVVAVYAMLGLDPKRGITFLVWTLPDSQEFASRVTPALFYRFFMLQFGINFWLSWVATIIALISTAGIIPSLVSSGSIDTMLSKPIGRVRLFLTKYLTGLLFVVLQVGVFAVGCLLVIGIRAGVWEWGLLLAVPIVTLFFSYLFAISALVGMISRSAMTAVLITALVWFLVFIVNMADGILLGQKAQREYQRDVAAAQMEWYTNTIEELEARVAEEEASGEADDSRTQQRLDRTRGMLADAERQLADAEEGVPEITRWYNYVYSFKTVLPKTGETVALLERWLVDTSELSRMFPGVFGDEQVDIGEGDASNNPGKVATVNQRVTAETRARSLAWVIGTSLLFEGVLLGVCCFIFWRRDF